VSLAYGTTVHSQIQCVHLTSKECTKCNVLYTQLSEHSGFYCVGPEQGFYCVGSDQDVNPG